MTYEKGVDVLVNLNIRIGNLLKKQLKTVFSDI